MVDKVDAVLEVVAVIAELKSNDTADVWLPQVLADYFDTVQQQVAVTADLYAYGIVDVWFPDSEKLMGCKTRIAVLAQKRG